VNVENLRHGFWRHFPFAAIVGVIIALEMAAVLMGGFRMSDPVASLGASGQLAPVSNTRELGKLIFTHYLYPLEIAAAILLVAMIAAIALTLRARKDSKYVSPGDQVRVKSKDRMVVVKMAATQAAPEVQAATEPEVK
jgi:NADH-quinone oxidoreductase subunit J